MDLNSIELEYRELDYKDIGLRIKERRLRQKLNQEQLAERSNLSSTHMSHIETGNTKLSLPSLHKIAWFLKTPMDTLTCDSNVLPKYGFPIDTVELLPDATNFSDTKRPQMQRDLQLAVAEYAPGAEIVADGKLYTSRYIRKLQSSNTHNWEYGWYAKCPHCETDNFCKDSTGRSSRACASCGETISKMKWQQTLEPRRGFISEKPTEVKMSKPERLYKTDDCYIGDTHRVAIDTLKFSVNNMLISVESTTNDSLVVLTQKEFRVCSFCGYALETHVTNWKEQFSNHKTAYGKSCSNRDASKFIGYRLSHDFKTDVARITFETARADYSTMLSVLFALLEAVSKELNIERNDIKGCLFKTKLDDGSLVDSIVLYDTAAGGARHIRRTITQDGDVFPPY